MSNPDDNLARGDESERAYYQRLRRILKEANLDDARHNKLATRLEEHQLGHLPAEAPGTRMQNDGWGISTCPCRQCEPVPAPGV